jgi:hypothetical protein
VPAESCRESDCRIDDDKVLIECALGARWGFYKFPPDPADEDPLGHDRLVWRELPQESILLESGEPTPAGAGQASLVFDLGLPLAPQVEQAKRRLQIEQRRRIAAGLVTTPRIADHAERLALALRLLDGAAQGLSQQARAALLSLAPEAVKRAEAEALSLREGGYRQLLWLRS